MFCYVSQSIYDVTTIFTYEIHVFLCEHLCLVYEISLHHTLCRSFEMVRKAEIRNGHTL